MTFALRRFTVAILAGAVFVSAGSSVVLAQAKPNNKKPNIVQSDQPPEKPKPLALKLISAQRGKFYGSDVLLVTGIEPISGKQRVFAVENERPQNPNDPPKFAPRAAIKSEIDKVKPGEYLRIEPKASKDGKDWIDDAEPYTLAEHEEEPGTFIMRSAYEEEVDGNKVHKIELIKFAQIFDCYAAMIKEERKMVPDPEVVKAAEAVKEKDLIEATVTQQGRNLFVTSIDPYSAARKATFTKMTETEGTAGKVPAVELDEGGTPVTIQLPGKLNGKKWVPDASMLANVRKAKPGTAVLFKTRDVEQKPHLRAFALAPKESTKKETTDSKGSKDTIMKDK